MDDHQANMQREESGPTTPFGAAMLRDHFAFAQTYPPLNHGSYGATPRGGLAYRQHLGAETEARPDTFIRLTYQDLLRESRAAVAELLGASMDEVVLIPNATTGVNTILRNLEYGDDDVILHFNTIYGACLKTLESLEDTTPVRTLEVSIIYPIQDDEILQRFQDAITAVETQGRKAKLAIFDAVLTFPGMRFPWEMLVDKCRQRGVLSLIDGAHGIGHIDLAHLGISLWLMVPRGGAVLYVPFRNQHMIRTTFPTSWNYENPKTRLANDTENFFRTLVY
ncbi:pyridoxal phosphate-dependent transferase [Xylariomycetidae sp. FL0641]|nr:pyridoxal phosphate-dependent transferase [Xylariomycetidae sp. FL0641]